MCDFIVSYFLFVLLFLLFFFFFFFFYFFFCFFFYFFFNDTATTEIYTSFPTRRSSDLHARAHTGRVERDPKAHRDPHRCWKAQGSGGGSQERHRPRQAADARGPSGLAGRVCAARQDRKSTRLNSSH